MHRRTSLVTIGCTGLVVAMAGTALPAFATTPSAATVVESVQGLRGPNVVDYEHAADADGLLYPQVTFSSSRREVVQGVRNNDGCRFTYSSVRSEAGATRLVERAYDPDTCSMLIEHGTASADASSPAGGGSAGDQASVTVPGGGGGGQIASLATLQQHYAVQRSWFDEPARWAIGEEREAGGLLPVVTSVDSSVTWVPDGTCAAAPGFTAYMNRDYTWFTTTGWNLESESWSHTTSTACSNEIYSSSRAKFQNREFCGLFGLLYTLFPTVNYYEPTKVTGYANGAALGQDVSSKTGPCSVLLMHGSKLVTS